MTTTRNTNTTTPAPASTPAYDWRLDAELQAFEAAAAAVASETPKPAKTAKAREARHIVAPAWGDTFDACAIQLLDALTAYGQTTLYRLVYLYVSLRLADYEAAAAAYAAYSPLAAVMDGIAAAGGDVRAAVAMRKSGALLCDIAAAFGIELDPPADPGTEEQYTRSLFFDAACIPLAIGRESRDDATKRRNFQRVFNEFAASAEGRGLCAVNSSTACKSVSMLLSQTILLLTTQYRDVMCDLHLPDCMSDLIPTERVIKTAAAAASVLPAGLIKK